MTGGRLVPDDQFLDVLHDFEHTAFRLELQRAYGEPEEDALFAAFLAGRPPSATTVPELDAWFSRIRKHVAAGKRIERVRVHEEPPTAYQRFERWLDRWNLAAGEVMRYMTRRMAHEVGLLPAAGDEDWWLLDSQRLLVMRFDGAGRRVENELITDASIVLRACAWRDLGVQHSDRAPPPAPEGLP